MRSLDRLICLTLSAGAGARLLGYGLEPPAGWLAGGTLAQVPDLRGRAPAGAGDIVHVTDGDTLRDVESGTVFHLHGADACEAHQVARRGRQTGPCGTIATATIAEWVAGQTVTCRGAATDVYGRMLAVCGTAQVPDIGAALIREGLAVAYRYRGQFAQPSHRAPEDEARAAKRGIWGLSEPLDPARVPTRAQMAPVASSGAPMATAMPPITP